MLALWDARQRLLDITESAPQTLVHCDFWPANVFVGDDGRAVAVDWSQIGIGGLAQDLDQITLDPVWMQARPDFPLERLEELVVPAYIEGLHEAGAEVTEEQVRWWYAAAAALHYSWMAGGIVQAARKPDMWPRKKTVRPPVRGAGRRPGTCRRAALTLGEGCQSRR